LAQIIFIRGIIGGLTLLFFLKLTKRSISFSSAVGMAELPFGAPVEIEAEVEIST
jgi:hypothetical protein